MSHVEKKLVNTIGVECAAYREGIVPSVIQ